MKQLLNLIRNIEVDLFKTKTMIATKSLDTKLYKYGPACLLSLKSAFLISMSFKLVNL